MRRLLPYLLSMYLLSMLFLASPAMAQETLRVVSWNMRATLVEGIKKREEQLRHFLNVTQPDVLVLVEVAGLEEAKLIASYTGWANYHVVVSNFNVIEDNALFALEVAVLSNVKILEVTEFDAPDKDGAERAFGAGDLAAELPTVAEEKLENAALSPLGRFTPGDRGSLRVDLDHNLTIFPVHLKSSFNGSCLKIEDARKTIRSHDNDLAQRLTRYFDEGFRAATEEHLDNARKRERMMAAVLQKANDAADRGRKVLIAGDFNTSFEKGKWGKRLDSDCDLHDFSCKAAPFPEDVCGGDGFDDTLSIPTVPLIGSRKWEFLTRDMGRTFVSEEFADKAIDHLVVPKDQESLFSPPARVGESFGSDHFPILTEFKKRP
jgi:endonuclease/exonuclease/phosphatase family metal-dependent hydrolase